MPIHEKSLIEPERLVTTEKLVLDGIDVSGHWNTMIRQRTVFDYDPDFAKRIESMPGGEYVYRCWQCGSCTNSCTVNAENKDFNPRYWIYLTNLGLVGELLKDKDIIWQCVSCNKCVNICPKEVNPEGVMKALAHWLEHEGHTEKRPSTLFDEEFTRQCLDRGKIEEAEIMTAFFRDTRQDVKELVKNDWLGVMIQRAGKLDLLRQGKIGKFLARLPIVQPLRMAIGMLFKPKTKGWGRTGEVLRQYVAEQQARVHAKH
jgi:heterodisulfide reductase subunit C